MMKEKKRFSIVGRIQSATHAWRGLGVLISTSYNARLHLFFAILAIYLGIILHISEVEWVLIILTIGLVIMAEAFNTAVEIDIDLTSPNYHPYARDTKDVAAAAVAICAFIACIVGIVIFLPKIF